MVKKQNATFITHNGNFHMDDVASCVIFNELHPESDYNVFIYRSDHNELHANYLENRETWVADVGQIYDPSMNNFDHHQDKNLDSAIGLVWSKYGNDYISCVLNKIDKDQEVSIRLIRYINNYMKNHIIDYITVVDNNIDNHFQQCRRVDKLVSGAALIGALNDVNDSNQQYLKAVEFMDEIFQGLIRKSLFLWKSAKIWDGKKYLVSLTNLSVVELSDVAPISDRTGFDFVLYPNSTEGSGYYKLRARDSSIKPLIRPQMVDPNDLVFYHARDFLMTFKNRESAIKYIVEELTPNYSSSVPV